jgi:hypothetical protein
MVVMGEEPRSTLFCLFGLICQLFGYSHSTVALPPKRVLTHSFFVHMYQFRSSRPQYIIPETGPVA